MCYFIKLNNKNKFGKNTIKLVDSGVWALYTGKSDRNKKVKYALDTGEEYYFLDKNGEVIFKSKNLNSFKREDIARFSKIKIPDSLMKLTK